MRKKQPVLAITPQGNIIYPSIASCMERYGLSSANHLERKIDRAKLASDRKTFFDYYSTPDETEKDLKEIRALISQIVRKSTIFDGDEKDG